MSVYPKQYADVNIVEEQRAKWEKKRIRTTKELIETERRYFEQLELVSMYFIEILKAKGTLKPNIHDAIFSSIKLIHSANQRFLGNLEHGEFGLGFENLSSHLHFYKIYADNMENAFKVLQIQIKKNKSFARFKKLQETRPEFRGLVLEDLLTLPLQRIQQYKHFLRDLIENTSPDGSGFQQLTRALKAVSDISDHIQDSARKRENYQNIHRVQKLLKGRKTMVLASGRWYIREGWINVLHPKSKEAKQKMVFLFSDILLVTKPCHPLHPTNSNKFSCQAVYPLLECSVDKVFGYTRSQGGLISLTFPHEKLLLMSNDQEDINDWYRCLSSAIGQVSSTKLTASATTTDLVSCSTKVGID
ncbi:rho guanine nucleotide exchange factor 39 isoform X1 [Erpetoichthys calabaricus]|uniref:rho guanine nucleotide exchange factor 39 isoform X1 n=1 Tax=Erpetoichthys calabaricus TaxID=27687 RepID=UPI00109F11D5|nr:rho guanine nucleotide exchange factor 39 isoform X1 [Erpetoichthys calabaricus]